MIEKLKRAGVKYRHRIFENILETDSRSAPLSANIITKIALEKGYTDRLKKLKGNTIIEWSRSLKTDGSGAPNRWATLGAVEYMRQEGWLPDSDDLELWCTLVFHWSIARDLGSISDALSSIQNEFNRELPSTLERGIELFVGGDE